MKIHFFYLSLLATAAHARHEPKNLRGRDDLDLDLVEETSGSNHSVPKGSSATIHCGSGGKCCLPNSFTSTVNTGYSTFDSSCGNGRSSTGAELIGCKQNTCPVSCVGNCNVVVKAGSGGGSNVSGKPRLNPPFPVPSPTYGGWRWPVPTPSFPVPAHKPVYERFGWPRPTPSFPVPSPTHGGGYGGKPSFNPPPASAPKQIYGSVETTVPNGGSATVTCGSGAGQCCVTGNISSSNSSVYGGDSCAVGTPMTGGSTMTCESNCSVSCQGSCSVSIHAGSAGRSEVAAEEEEATENDGDYSNE